MLCSPKQDVEVTKHRVRVPVARILIVPAMCDCEAKIPIGLDGLSYVRNANLEVINSYQHVAV